MNLKNVIQDFLVFHFIFPTHRKDALVRLHFENLLFFSGLNTRIENT